MFHSQHTLGTRKPFYFFLPHLDLRLHDLSTHTPIKWRRYCAKRYMESVRVGVRGNNFNSHPMAHPFLGNGVGENACVCVCVVRKVAVRTLTFNQKTLYAINVK